MNPQLLLLLALVGPFCALTRASPTAVPPEFGGAINETVADVANTTDVLTTLAVVTGPLPTAPATAPEKVGTDVSLYTEGKTEEPNAKTDTRSVAAVTTPEPLITHPPITDPHAVETPAPTQTAREVQPAATAAADAGPTKDVMIEQGTQEGLSSGQVAGIVIGALLAVVIVIAVLIVVARRMGKYSP